MGEWTIFITTTVIIVASIAIIAWFYNKKDDKKGKKCKGRNDKSGKAVAAAKTFSRSNSFKCISPAQLVRGDKIANLDAIIVGYFGILAVKEYGYNGEIYGAANDEKWLQIAENGQRNYFANPIIEASADVRVIRDALFEIKLRQIPVEVVCVFSDTKAQLALGKKTEYYTLKSFKNLIQKEKYMVDKGFDLEQVETVLRKSCNE